MRLRTRAARITRRFGFEVVRGYAPRKGVIAGAVEAPPAALPSALVSFSLYGSGDLYLVGALRNAEMYPELFPGWGLIYFVGDSVPRDVACSLDAIPWVTVIRMAGEVEGHASMTWRYLAADWPGVSAVIFRDVDCRPNLRERAAVDQWLLSGLTVHVMRDHPGHTQPVMGGMWGIRPQQSSQRLGKLISDYQPDGNFSGDQRFLHSQIYSRYAGSMLVHQDANYFSDGASTTVQRFPVLAEPGRFVGQGFDSHDRIRQGHSSDGSE